MEKALRYNEDKLKMSLVPTELIEGVAGVLTYGANKYTVRDEEGNITTRGDNNWRKGLPWMSVIDSLERHLLAFKKGEDLDSESGLLHLAHAATNIAFLMNYYGSHPELDDRIHRTLNKPRITLDVDDIVCDYVAAYCEKYNLKPPNCWKFDPNMDERIQEMIKKGEYEDFLSKLKPKFDPKELSFPIHGYVTARNSSLRGVTEKWLFDNGFPLSPVHFSDGKSKADIIKSLGGIVHLDDNYEHYIDLNSKGIACYLLTCSHNIKYNAGDRRVENIQEFKQKFGYV